jgi:CelD/BcsL family acetyltransferase involved in cellulose biosynthesis
MPELAPHTGRALRVTIEHDAAALPRLAPCWAALRRRARRATPFQDPAWLLPWQSVLGSGEPRFVCVWDGAQLAALAPLEVWTNGDGVRRLLLLGTGVTDYGDVLLDPDMPEAAFALADALRSLRAEVQETRFEEVRPEAALWSLAADGGVARAATPCPLRHLATPWSARARRRRTLAENRAARRGAVEVEWAASAPAIERGIALLLALHEARWRIAGQAGVLDLPKLQQFHREAAHRAGKAGLLRLAVLTIGGQPAAVYYGLADRHMACGYLTGMDPAFTFESPGSLLLYRVIDAARDEGCSEFHFLRGDEPYKQMFADETRWNRHLVWTGASRTSPRPG